MFRPVARLLLLGALSVSVSLAAQAPASNQAPAGKGIIRGVVTAADTGRPIVRAEVRLTSAGLTPPYNRAVFTDDKGRFEATALRAGRYSLSASKPGYLGLAYGQTRPRESGRPIDLTETMALDNVDVVLPRASVIVARVLDQFGEPVRGVAVRALLPQYVDMYGRRMLWTGGGTSSVTDDRGETRIHGLQPGDYYLVAAPDIGSWRGDVETLYPGTLDIREAQTVRVGIGEEAFASFPIRRARPAALSGTIIGSNGAPLPSPYVSLQEIRVAGGGSSRRMTVAPDGTFRQDNLLPGEWMVVVNEPEYGMASTRLLGEDVHGLTITTRKAATVRGRVTFEGTPPTDSVQIGVTFEGPRTLVSGAGFLRSGASVSTISATPETNWTFEAQVSGAGVIRSRVNGWLLKSVLLDGKDVTDTVLDFGSAYAGKPVEVVLTQRRTQLSGGVTNDRGQSATSYVVVLFPEDEAEWTKVSSRFFGTARPDQQGRFVLTSLPPGRYLAAAVEYLGPGENRDPESLARLRSSATPIALTEGEARSVTLRMAR